MREPRVTVGVPLYGAKRFLGSLRRNLESLAAEDDVAVIVSDRHRLDNTIDVLEKEWQSCDKIRFIRTDDRLNWVDHMNRLLLEAEGEYFRWLPHDDIFPVGCIRPLVRRLDSEPGVILAYGPTRAIDFTEARCLERDRVGTCPVPPGERWTFDHSMGLFWRGWCNGAFKGLFRRRDILDAGLFIRPTRDLVFAERAWLFGVSLLGALAEEPDSEYLKRYHDKSVSSSWEPGIRHIFSATATMCGYLRDHGPAGAARLRGTVYHWAKAASAVRWLLKHEHNARKAT